MTDMISPSQLEENIRRSFDVPEIRPEFIDQVYTDLMQRAEIKPPKKHGYLLGLRPTWVFTLILLALLIIGTLAIGPDRVYAALRQLFGYIPGIGIVDQSAPIRLLAEPVSATRDGVTVSVNRAVLTASETRIDFGVSAVPLSAYPQGEIISGCLEHEYLRLPDGTKMDVNVPIPANVNEATFVLPCIFNTLPGTVPTGWALLLRFIPASPELTILPIIDVTVQTSPTNNQPESNEITLTATPQEIPRAVVSVDKVIETEDGYILLGSVRPNLPEGSWLEITGAATIRDADGKKVSYAFPNDVQPLDDLNLTQGGFSWVMQIKGAGVKFPLTISFSGIIISQVDPQALARVTIDAGTNPQPEQVWEINQDVQVGNNMIRLVSVTALSDGYSFRIDPGKNLSGVSVEIEGHPAVGGGGGGPPGKEFTTSMVYMEIPQGQLTILFSNPLSTSPTEIWQGKWQPGAVREFPLMNRSSESCLNADSLQALRPLPAGLDGKTVFTRLNPQLQIVLANMNGSQQEIIVTGYGRAAITQDGSRIVYSTAEGIMIQNLSSGETTMIAGVFGRDLHWSPDGSRIAYVNSGDVFGIFVINNDGANPRQFSNLGYEAIAGWSPDGSKLYYAIPGSSGDGFLLRSVDVNAGDTQDIFVLENSSRKAPLPAVSPDGKWVAYRASDNSSLYLKGLDGSQAHLLLDNPATAINGIAWEREGHLLGVSLITPEYPDGEIILIAPDSCETYRLPGLSGELDGVFIP